MPPHGAASPAHRIAWIDVARGVALVAMAVYHFTWDLEFFGYVDPGLTAVGGWKLFARGIASSFLVLVGVSLLLSHGAGVRWASFGRRFAMVLAAALAVSIATYLATPGSFIFFGILHEIAFASLAGLLFLRLPPLVTLAAAAAVIAAPFVFTSALFDAPWWWWTGLSEARPRS
ncbi:MAG: heparan-alpha-glucosaminide N-acetyltransferase, partial [Mesorhizobium sp.]|nr:heparan-alpha-glucosaminide N-acetyltransferase [Mesorhizobium sp.]